MLSFTVKSVTNTFAFLIRSKNLGLMAIVFAMLFSISAYGSNASQLSFIDSTTEFLGLQSSQDKLLHFKTIGPAEVKREMAEGKHGSPPDSPNWLDAAAWVDLISKQPQPIAGRELCEVT